MGHEMLMHACPCHHRCALAGLVGAGGRPAPGRPLLCLLPPARRCQQTRHRGPHAHGRQWQGASSSGGGSRSAPRPGLVSQAGPPGHLTGRWKLACWQGWVAAMCSSKQLERSAFLRTPRRLMCILPRPAGQCRARPLQGAGQLPPLDRCLQAGGARRRAWQGRSRRPAAAAHRDSRGGPLRPAVGQVGAS